MAVLTSASWLRLDSKTAVSHSRVSALPISFFETARKATTTTG